MDITQNLKDSKAALLNYFRNRAEEEIQYLANEYTANEFKEKNP